MKIFLLALITLLIFSCNPNKKFIQNYYFVEPFREQEVKLVLRSDSTFKLQDITGCNQFEYSGTYKQLTNSAFKYLVFDSVRLQPLLSNFDSTLLFSIRGGDTAWIINRERLSIHKQPFKIILNSNIDLQKIRYEKLEAYYIDFLGREEFIKVFGNGKGIKEAKRRLLECTLPDINLR